MQKFSSFGRKKKTDQNSTENGYAVTSSTTPTAVASTAYDDY